MTILPPQTLRANFDWLSLLGKHRAIAIIRVDDFMMGYNMARAVAKGGLPLIEITWNSHRAGDLISKLVAELPDCLIGVGTVLSVADLLDAIAAGASFVFTPHVDIEIIQTARSHNIPIVAGALTPTEIITAWKYGASSIKIFPVQCVGGSNYIRAIRPPLGDIPLIPTGGVTIANALDYLNAGATAIGISGDLFPKSLLSESNWSGITQQAEKLVRILQS